MRPKKIRLMMYAKSMVKEVYSEFQEYSLPCLKLYVLVALTPPSDAMLAKKWFFPFFDLLINW